MKNNLSSLHVVKMASYLLFIGSTHTYQAQSSNVLAKAAHHCGTPKNLVLGNVSLCFLHKPVYEKLPQTNYKGMQQEGYFFPHVKAEEALIAQFNGAQEKLNKRTVKKRTITHTEMLARVKKYGYTAMLKEAATGLQLVIAYDPEKVSIDSCLQSYVCIDSQKGLCIDFRNKPMLRTLNEYDEKILRTARMSPKPVIVIDPGHGGSDCGAKSCCNDLEKDIALNVGMQLAALLKDAPCTVILTRDTDRTVTLDERTSCANRHHADLFISLHANHAGRDSVCGIETFCLDDSFYRYGYGDKKESMLVQAFRNGITKQSMQLAECLQQKVVSCIKNKHGAIVSRDVKQAVAQVLMGTMMPSALIELGFLSNKAEAALLKSKQYQRLLASGIRDGIMAYLAEVKMG